MLFKDDKNSPEGSPRSGENKKTGGVTDGVVIHAPIDSPIWS